MTTFHDPPQSRRAARQSEREQASDEQPQTEGFTTFPSQEAAPAPENRVSTPPAAVPATPAAPPALISPPAASRPAADPAYRAAPPPSPQSQSSTFAPPPPASPAAPVSPAAEENASERTLTRRELRELRAQRDAETAEKSPESSETPESSKAPVAPVLPSAGAQPAAQAPSQPAVSSPSTAAPVQSAPATNANADAVAQYPYSGAAGSAPASAVAPAKTMPPAPSYVEPAAVIDPLSVVPEAASAAVPPEDALSTFESLLASANATASEEKTSASPRSPLAGLQADVKSAAPAAETVAKAQPRAEQTFTGLLGLSHEPAIDPSAPTTAGSATNLSNARAEFDELARKRLESQPAPSSPAIPAQAAAPAPLAPAPSVDAPAASSAAALHWSSQAAAADEPSNSVVSRTIGSGTSATSALVLPAIPFATDIRGALNSSGETMLTGSIDLPSTLSASGVSDRFDHGDIDSLLDLNDSDMVSTDSAPVRAVKAVSTFSNQSVTQTQKPKGTRALTVLLISASSMAVVVAGLLVAAFAFNML